MWVKVLLADVSAEAEEMLLEKKHDCENQRVDLFATRLAYWNFMAVYQWSRQQELDQVTADLVALLEAAHLKDLPEQRSCSLVSFWLSIPWASIWTWQRIIKEFCSHLRNVPTLCGLLRYTRNLRSLIKGDSCVASFEDVEMRPVKLEGHRQHSWSCSSS